MAEISSGANVFSSPLKVTWIRGSFDGPGTTLKGKRFRSSAMAWSFILRPIRPAGQWGKVVNKTMR